jgi:uncharacterized membrane protein YgcG
VRRRRRTTLALTIVLAALPLFAGTAGAEVGSCPYVCSWDAGQRPIDVIRAVRGGLVTVRPGLPDERARDSLDRAIMAIDWTLQDARWTPAGTLRPTAAGAGGIVGLRLAAARLHWGDPDVAPPTQKELRGLVAVMSRLVSLRLTEVATAGADATSVWRAKYDADRADEYFPDRPLQASYSYREAWFRLAVLPPHDSHEPPPSSLPDETVVPGGDSGGGGSSGGGSTPGGGGGGGGTPGTGAGAEPIVVSALPSVARAGQAVPLRYRVRGSQATQEDVWVRYGTKVVTRLRTPFGDRSTRAATVRLKAISRLGRLSFCVRARDRSGRASAPSCARLEIRFVVRAFATSGVAGRVIHQRYRIASKQPTRSTIVVTDGRRRVGVVNVSRPSTTIIRTALWRSSRALAGRKLSFCITSRSVSGHRSIKSCARVKLSRPH